MARCCHMPGAYPTRLVHINDPSPASQPWESQLACLASAASDTIKCLRSAAPTLHEQMLTFLLAPFKEGAVMG